MLSVDTNSLKHLPKQSSKNCDLQFANCDSSLLTAADLRRIIVSMLVCSKYNSVFFETLLTGGCAGVEGFCRLQRPQEILLSVALPQQ